MDKKRMPANDTFTLASWYLEKSRLNGQSIEIPSLGITIPPYSKEELAAKDAANSQ